MVTKSLCKYFTMKTNSLLNYPSPCLLGLATQLAPMYLTEIAPFNLRGAFGTANQLFITIGIFAGSVFGLREILGESLCLNCCTSYHIV